MGLFSKKKKTVPDDTVKYSELNCSDEVIIIKKFIILLVVISFLGCTTLGSKKSTLKEDAQVSRDKNSQSSIFDYDNYGAYINEALNIKFELPKEIRLAVFIKGGVYQEIKILSKHLEILKKGINNGDRKISLIKIPKLLYPDQSIDFSEDEVILIIRKVAARLQTNLVLVYQIEFGEDDLYSWTYYDIPPLININLDGFILDVKTGIMPYVVHLDSELALKENQIGFDYYGDNNEYYKAIEKLLGDKLDEMILNLAENLKIFFNN